MTSAILYRLTSPNGKGYIGVTERSLRERILSHLHVDTVIGAALRKYGSMTFRVETLVIGERDFIYELEKRAIAKFDTLAPNGYNIGAGGEGGGRGYHTEKTKQKIANSHLGLRPSLETQQRLAAAHTGNRHSEETRNKMSESQQKRLASMTKKERRQMYGRICSEETKHKLVETTRQSWAEGGIRRCR